MYTPANSPDSKLFPISVILVSSGPSVADPADVLKLTYRSNSGALAHFNPTFLERICIWFLRRKLKERATR